MKNRTIKIEKTARYTTIGNKEKAKVLIVALHGYGQLSTYFSKHFNTLDERYYIIIPEGLSRFYISGTSGRVGSSWMTKEERLIDIEDNLNYLNKLYVSEECHLFKTKIMIGFSQGASTGFRWLINTPDFFQSFISWGSAIPDDLEFEKMKNVLPPMRFFVLGNNDPYFPEIQKDNVVMQYNQLDFKIITFNGEHKIDIPILKAVLNSIK